jgi:N-succinyldiaminopimelate aminotransferase
MSDDNNATRLNALVRSPFVRLNALLEGIDPGAPPINLSLGEPRASVPPFLGPVLHEHLSEFGRYPPIRGIPALRQAIAGWMGRRYSALSGMIDPERHVLPLNGSREGLFAAVFPARARKPGITDPAVLIPNRSTRPTPPQLRRPAPHRCSCLATRKPGSCRRSRRSTRRS